MKTIKQIADEIGVTKQAVQKRISREPLKTDLQPYVSTVEGTKYIDDDGERLIKSAYSTMDNPVDNGIDNGIDSGVDAPIDTLQTLISMLQKELDIKNKQIEDLSAALVAAQQTANAAQALHAGTMQKAIADGRSETPDKKPGLWGRIFKRGQG